MTDEQQEIETKMLEGIKDEQDATVRAGRVEEYLNFIQACTIRKQNFPSEVRYAQ